MRKQLPSMEAVFMTVILQARNGNAWKRWSAVTTYHTSSLPAHSRLRRYLILTASTLNFGYSHFQGAALSKLGYQLDRGCARLTAALST